MSANSLAVALCNIGNKAFDTYLNVTPSPRYFYDNFKRNTFKSKSMYFISVAYLHQLKSLLAVFPRSNELHSISKTLTSFKCKCLGLSHYAKPWLHLRANDNDESTLLKFMKPENCELIKRISFLVCLRHKNHSKA